MKSLKHQFIGAVNDNFHKGVNKHSYKRLKYKKVKIVSYSYRKNLINFGCSLANYLTNTYDLKYLKEIEKDHVIAFFDYLKFNGCKDTTLRQYKSYLSIYDKLITQTYHIKLHLKDYIGKIDVNNKLRDVAMIENHLNMVIEQNKIDDCASLLGLKICKYYGLRASEVSKLKAKDFDIEKEVLHIINSKNGKSRDISINTKQRYDLAHEIRMSFNDEERVVPIQPDSINRYLNRKLNQNGIKIYSDRKTGIHSIRKMVASEIHQENLKKGITETESYKKIIVELGHGNGRTDLAKNTYCKY